MRRTWEHITSTLVAAMLIGPMALGSRGAEAQSAKVIEQFAKEPHTGTVEQALVGIEVVTVSDDGMKTEVRHGDGFMLRCDGFVLAPADLFSLRMAGQKALATRQSVTVLLHPGTEQEQRLPGRRPRILGSELRIADKLYPLGYAVLKLDNIHTPALRTLLPDTLQPGTEVQIVGCAWDEATHKFTARQQRTAKIGDPPKDPGHLPPGFMPFAEPQKDVAAGSVVIGPEGMAVGVIGGKGQVASADGFLAFAVLYEATNCVLPAPTPDAQFTKGNKEAGDTPPAAAESANEAVGDMVRVPGGPVVLPRVLLDAQPDMEGATVACIPPFQIDRNEVTNRDYLAFWESLPEKERQKENVRFAYYPFGWNPADPPFAPDVALLPVLGVPLTGQQAYARWKGKRLPTPYEWLLAAYGPKGVSEPPEWVKNYVAETVETWLKVRQAHYDYANANPAVIRNYLVDRIWIPWIALRPEGMEAAAWSKQIVEAATAPLWSKWKDPPYLLPVGSRSFDKSPCGAMDMLLNAEETVVSLPGVPYRNNLVTMHVTWPSDTRYFKVVTEMSPMTAGSHPLVEGISPPRLSRLYHRAYVSPFLDYIKTFSNLHETADMLRPLAGPELRLENRKTETLNWTHPFRVATSTSRNPRGGLSSSYEAGTVLDVYSPAIATPGFRLWMGMPAHFRAEMGRPIPWDSTGAMTDTENAELYYVAPTGFRCAR